MAALCKSFFDGSSSPGASAIDLSRLEEKVFILLDWAIGLFQLGNHRPYAAYTLLHRWSEQYDEHRPKPFDFYPILYKWLDTFPAAKKEDNALAIGITFGELIRQGLFSYSRYLQSLIANGHTARSRKTGSDKSHHLALLAAMPIFVTAENLKEQRRIALSGDDLGKRQRDEDAEEVALEAVKEEVREYVPEIFGWSGLVCDDLADNPLRAVWTECRNPDFCQSSNTILRGAHSISPRAVPAMGVSVGREQFDKVRRGRRRSQLTW